MWVNIPAMAVFTLATAADSYRNIYSAAGYMCVLALVLYIVGFLQKANYAVDLGYIMKY